MVVMIKRDFPFFVHNPQLHYLDNAATTHKPTSVIDALAHFYQEANAPVHRGIYRHAENATLLYEQVRSKLAAYGNALPEEFVFTRGTTESINLVAQAWAAHQLHEGDEIIISELEHHANILPWQMLAQKNKLKLCWAPVDNNGVLAPEAVLDLISNKTKLVALTHTSHVTGQQLDLAPIIERAHQVGARVLVDAAQAMAHQRIDLARLKADFLAFSAHKMFGPTGSGVLFVRKELHHQLKPSTYGGGMIGHVDKEQATWRSMPHMLEAGTPAIASVIGLGTALDYLAKMDFKALKSHEAGLLNILIENLQKMPHIRILGPLNELRQRGHLLSFTVQGYHPHDIAAFLDTHSIAVRAGDHCAQPIHRAVGLPGSVRVSLAAYSTPEDIEALVSALKQL